MVDRVVSREEVHIEKHDAPTGEEFAMVDAATEEVLCEVTEEDMKEEGVQPTAAEYEELAMKIALALQNLVRMGDQAQCILVHPNLIDGVKEALYSLPEGSFSQQDRAMIQIAPDPRVEVKIITANEIEFAFLRGYFGPTEQGGNGLIPKLQQHLEINNLPVIIDVGFLRTKFLLEVSERLAPSIVKPPLGSNLITGLRSDRR